MITRVLNNLRGQWIGVLALFIALGGTGYAAISIPRHSVGRRQLRPGAVGEAQLGRHSVGARQLRRHAVTQKALKSASVGSRQLRKSSVRGTQLAPGAVTASKIGAGQVGSGQLAAGSVGTSQLAAGAVGQGQLANGSVGNAQLVPGSVTPADFAGVGGYTWAFAIVGATGNASGAPSVSTSGDNGQGLWSNGNGDVNFVGGTPTTACLAFSSVPSADQSGAPVDTTATIANHTSGVTTIQVQTPSYPGPTVSMAVWIECAT